MRCPSASQEMHAAHPSGALPACPSTGSEALVADTQLSRLALSVLDTGLKMHPVAGVIPEKPGAHPCQRGQRVRQRRGGGDDRARGEDERQVLQLRHARAQHSSPACARQRGSCGRARKQQQGQQVLGRLLRQGRRGCQPHKCTGWEQGLAGDAEPGQPATAFLQFLPSLSDCP